LAEIKNDPLLELQDRSYSLQDREDLRVKNTLGEGLKVEKALRR